METAAGTGLGSWAEGQTKQAIRAFVAQVTDPASGGYVAPPERVAVFDNDGTLWAEKPMPIQLDFTLRRLAAMAGTDPALQQVQPWQAAYEKDYAWLSAAMVKHYHGDDSDLALLMKAVPRAFEAMTVEEFADQVDEFFGAAQHPTLDRAYRECGYRPMTELLRYLEDHGFTCYIASGGDRDFMRPIADDLYGVPPERVIGSSLALAYRPTGDRSSVLYKAQMEFFDDGPTKPVRIWSRIGRRPILAVGNSNGDLPMLEFSGTGSKPSLRMLILHDDEVREFDYIAGAEDALARAVHDGWTVVSMRDDWTSVFQEATTSR